MARYSSSVLARLDELKTEIENASTDVMVLMAPGESHEACYSRQKQIVATEERLLDAVVEVFVELSALGSSGDCVPNADVGDINAAIRQLFEDARHKAWWRTMEDAMSLQLEAAE